MKKFVLFTLLLMASVWAHADLTKIRCTTYPVWLLTAEITKDARNLSVEVVIPPGTGCPHDYVLTPRDMERLSEPDQVVITNGLGMDGFIVEALQKVNPGVPFMEAALPEDQAVLFDAAKSPNPHLFASPDTARAMAKNIAAKLSSLDAARAELYRKNAQQLDAELSAMAEKFAAFKAADGKNVPTVVIQHGIFSYLARLMGVKVILLSESDDETSLTPVQLRRLVREVRKTNAAMIWADIHAPQDAVNTLARECKLPVVRLDMLSGGDVKVATGHYCRTMEKNLKTLEKHWR